jgi:choline dehydrogenase-like flavoprotein
MPIASPQLFKTKYDWDFASEPESGLGDWQIYLPRGKTLGGSSAINAMIYICGNAADFDGWAVEEGTAVVVVPGDAALLHQVRVQRGDPHSGRSHDGRQRSTAPSDPPSRPQWICSNLSAGSSAASFSLVGCAT